MSNDGCPSCGVEAARTRAYVQKEEIQYGVSGPDAVMLLVTVRTHECLNCRLVWTDREAERARDEAVMRYLAMPKWWAQCRLCLGLRRVCSWVEYCGHHRMGVWRGCTGKLILHEHQDILEAAWRLGGREAVDALRLEP